MNPKIKVRLECRNPRNPPLVLLMNFINTHNHKYIAERERIPNNQERKREKDILASRNYNAITHLLFPLAASFNPRPKRIGTIGSRQIPKSSFEPRELNTTRAEDPGEEEEGKDSKFRYLLTFLFLREVLCLKKK